MIRKRRRETEIFSMSFMDCICCGFGAVLLIFILTTGRRVDFSQQDLKDLQERVRKLDIAVTQERSELDRLARATTVTEVDLKSLIEQNSSDKEKARVQQEQLKAMLQQSQQLHQTLAQLQTDIQKLPTEEEQPVPIPEVDRRQYLSGVKLDGEGAEYVLFIVRASGSMLGETLEDAVSRLEDPDFKKREAPKWQRVVKAIEWMIASLGPETKFHVLLFADETVPLLPAAATTGSPARTSRPCARRWRSCIRSCRRDPRTSSARSPRSGTCRGCPTRSCCSRTACRPRATPSRTTARLTTTRASAISATRSGSCRPASR